MAIKVATVMTSCSHKTVARGFHVGTRAHHARTAQTGALYQAHPRTTRAPSCGRIVWSLWRIIGLCDMYIRRAGANQGKCRRVRGDHGTAGAQLRVVSPHVMLHRQTINQAGRSQILSSKLQKIVLMIVLLFPFL